MDKMIEFVTALRDLCNDYLGTEEPAEEEVAKPARKAAPAKKAAAPAKKAASKAKAKEPEEDEHDERWDELAAMGVKALRAIAIKRGFDEEETNAEKNKMVLVENIWNDEKANPDDEDADDDSEDDEAEEDDSEVKYTRKDLEGIKSLAELRKLAKEAGFEASDLRGKDADAIIELMLGADEDEGDEEGDEYTEAELLDMSLADLKGLCKEAGIKVPRGSDVESLVALLMEAGEEDEDEE